MAKNGIFWRKFSIQRVHIGYFDEGQKMFYVIIVQGMWSWNCSWLCIGIQNDHNAG